MPYERHFARTRRPQCEQVVSIALDADTEIHGFNGSGLADELGQIFEIRGCLEIELANVATTIERLWFQSLYRHQYLLRMVTLLVEPSAVFAGFKQQEEC
jgi:hypothetical protein